VAALAYGTESVEAVDLIAGPGNVYGQLAKQMVAGVVGTDGGFYGPSEIVTIADASADPRCVAADLIAQAEHDPGKCFLIAWSPEVAREIAREVERQLAGRARSEIIEQALESESAAIVVADEDEAVALADRLAAEHVNLAVADPERLLGRIRNGGEFFLGDQSPVAPGDYYAGPSHCLPTGTTSRFASGVSVFTFLRRSGTVYYRDGLPRAVVEDVARLAEAEGLDAHAESARVRGRSPGSPGTPGRGSR
jgi:histidinol dehydrogenase